MRFSPNGKKEPWTCQSLFQKSVLWIRTGFNSDPDPAFYVNADPDTDPDPGFLGPKIGEKLQLEQNLNFLVKNCNLLIPRPP